MTDLKNHSYLVLGQVLRHKNAFSSSRRVFNHVNIRFSYSIGNTTKSVSLYKNLHLSEHREPESKRHFDDFRHSNQSSTFFKKIRVVCFQLNESI